MNRSRGAVVAADIPSGVEADTGRVLGHAVRADRTITFTLGKIGQFVGEGSLCAGEVSVREIGIPGDLVRRTVCPVQTLDRAFAAAVLPRRKADGHKGDFGKVLVVGGAAGYTGAPYLTAAAAVRSGCGLVSLGVPECIWAVEAVKCTSAMPFSLPEKHGMLSEKALGKIMERLSGCQVLALGPGIGRGSGPARLVRGAAARSGAAGRAGRRRHKRFGGTYRCVGCQTRPGDDFDAARRGVCPAGSRGSGERRPAAAAREFAAAHGCVLVLKGHRTVIAVPAGNVLVNTTGTSGLSKGGSGDVLTGMIASLLAQGAGAAAAAGLGVWLHGRAGDLAAERLTEYAMAPGTWWTACRKRSGRFWNNGG